MMSAEQIYVTDSIASDWGDCVFLDPLSHSRIASTIVRAVYGLPFRSVVVGELFLSRCQIELAQRPLCTEDCSQLFAAKNCHDEQQRNTDNDEGDSATGKHDGH